jgi:hypothetical protein
MQQPSSQEIAEWDHWFAAYFNNLAWTLAEREERTPAEGEEMLHLARASALHWSRVGNELNKMRADMLLAHIHALLGNGSLALSHAQRFYEYFSSQPSPGWEMALAEAILANAAAAAGNGPLHTEHYARAKVLGEAIAEDRDRIVFRRIFNQVPEPSDARRA